MSEQSASVEPLRKALQALVDAIEHSTEIHRFSVLWDQARAALASAPLVEPPTSALVHPTERAGEAVQRPVADDRADAARSFEAVRDCIHHGKWTRIDATEPDTVLNWGCRTEAPGQARCHRWCGDLKRCPAALAERTTS